MTTTPTAFPELPDLDRLEALARAATPSPWDLVHVVDRSIDHLCPVDRDNLSLLTVVHEGETPYGAVYRDDDARFMAAANPAAVLALIALARRAKPEGEAPQAVYPSNEIMAEICEVAGYANLSMQQIREVFDKHATAAQHAESGTPAASVQEQFDQWQHARLFANPPQSVTPYDAYVAGIAAQSQGAQAASIDGLPRYKLVPGDQREWMVPAADGAWCRFDHAAALAAKAEAPAIAFANDGREPDWQGYAEAERAQQAAAPGSLESKYAKALRNLLLDMECGVLDGDARREARDLLDSEDEAAPSAPGTPEAPKGGA